MKILKRPEGNVYDTANPDKIEFNPKPVHVYELQSLALITRKSGLAREWDFLKKYFKPKDDIMHPIFNNFGDSFYYGYYVTE